tara:strand:- start:507 stop:803 length:297 start_codon:yes stop_codon:yes gene_type:complete
MDWKIEGHELVITMEDSDDDIREDLEACVGDDLEGCALISEYFWRALDVIAPEEVGALTNSPLLLDASTETVYWFPNYQIENPIETLLEVGAVRFTDN